MSPATQLINQARDKEERASALTLRLGFIHDEMMSLAQYAATIRHERDQLLEDARDTRALAKAARAADRMTVRSLEVRM